MNKESLNQKIKEVMDAFNVEHVYVLDGEVYLTEKEGSERVTKGELDEVPKVLKVPKMPKVEDN